MSKLLGLLGILLMVGGAGGLLVAGSGLRPTALVEDTGSSVVERAHELELAAAWPALRQRASWQGLKTMARGGGAAAPQTSEGGVPSFAAWRAQPAAERWPLYQSPEWRPVRLTTRAGLGLVGGSLALVVGKAIGWPLFKGFWLVGSVVMMRRGGRPTGSHGTARLASREELLALRPRRGEAAFIVGEVGPFPFRHLVSIPEREHDAHMVCVAPTGAGKTSTLIVPNVLGERGKRTIIMTDPKRELMALTQAHVRQVYGERVLVLDFLDPTLSRGCNPLPWVTDATRADLFARTWVKNTGESKAEPVWDNMATLLIGAAALHLVKDAQARGVPCPPLVALKQLLADQPFETIKATLLGSPVPDVRALALGFMAYLEKHEKMLGGLMSEMPTRFKVLSIPEVRATTATAEIDFAALVREPHALYIGFALRYAETLAPLTASFFTQLFSTIAEEAARRPGGRLAVPVFAYLDEFGNLGHIPGFEKWISTVRSAGVGLLMVVQSTRQLVQSYGEEGKAIILENAMTKLCLGKATGDARYFSDLTGESTALSQSSGRSRGLTMPWADRGTTGEGEAARPVMTPDEVRRMSGKVLLIAQDRRPMLLRQRAWYRVRALARLVPQLVGDTLAPLRRAVALADPSMAPNIIPTAPDAPQGTTAHLENSVGTGTPTADTAPPGITGLSSPATPGQTDAPAGTTAAPSTPPTPAASPTDHKGGAGFASPQEAAGKSRAVRLSDTERAILDALAAAPASSSTALEQTTGINRNTVRGALKELRDKLGIDQAADIVQVARERDLLGGEAPGA